MDDKAKTNERPRIETIAGTGPGIPDDALGPGEALPEAPSDEAVERAAKALGVHGSSGKLPLEGQ
jgi:hypothetical protein